MKLIMHKYFFILIVLGCMANISMHMFAMEVGNADVKNGKQEEKEQGQVPPPSNDNTNNQNDLPPDIPGNTGANNNDSNGGLYAFIHGKCDKCTKFMDSFLNTPPAQWPLFHHLYENLPVTTRFALIAGVCVYVCKNETVQKIWGKAKEFTLKLVGIHGDDEDDENDDQDDDDRAQKNIQAIKTKNNNKKVDNAKIT